MRSPYSTICERCSKAVHQSGVGRPRKYCLACEPQDSRILRRLPPAPPIRPEPTTARPFTVAHFRHWASGLVLDTFEPWKPEPFQLAYVRDLFAGYPEAWLVVPEGNGKTTLLAGLALYHAEFKPFAVVSIAAASREQAEIMYRQAEGFVLRTAALFAPTHSAIQAAKGKLKTTVPRYTCLEGYRRINHYAGGRIQVFAADDRTGDGVIPSLAIIDEPHRQKDLSLYRTWSGKLAKRDGQLVAISTAGEPGSDFELTRERIRSTAVKSDRKGSFLRSETDRIVMHEWALVDGAEPDDIGAVKRANPFSAITVPMLRSKFDSPTMTLNHWLRFSCNRPTRDVESWLGDNGDVIWTDLTDPYDLRPGVPTYLGVDIGIRHDTSAVVVMQRRPDQDGKPAGRYHATCRIWWPTDARPVDVTDVMHHIRTLAARYDVTAVSYDPRFFDVPAKMLSDEGLPLVETPQVLERMTPAYVSLYGAIMGGKVTHDDDAAFTSQVLNGVPRYSERGFILEKGKSHGKIDAAVAMALAYDQVLRYEDEEPPVYEERGMVEV